MKKLMYILVFGWLALGLTGCDQDIDYPYSGKDRIQFKCYTYNSYTEIRTYIDSVTFSFGLKADSIIIDTAKVVIEYAGKGSDKERTYCVSIVPDSTTAIAGIHFKALDREQRFRRDKLTDTLRIVVFRENLSTDYDNPETIRLDLQLEPSEDFDLGIRQGLRKKILMNNYLSKPDWWDKNFFDGSLGFYHPKKWKILISFSDAFASQTTCPYDTNNEGSTYAKGLAAYLNAVPTYDDKTGYRIYINRLEAPEE